MAYGGTLEDSLFSNAIAASPFLPQQYGYKDFVPSQSYYAFASAAGCFGPPALPSNNFRNSIFSCLVSKDTATLQYASASVSGSGRYATWAFLPVTDGQFIQQLPSQQLLKKQVNGKSILLGVSYQLCCKAPVKTLGWLTSRRIMQTKGLPSRHPILLPKLTLRISYETRSLSSQTTTSLNFCGFTHRPMRRLIRTLQSLRHRVTEHPQLSTRALLPQANSNVQM